MNEKGNPYHDPATGQFTGPNGKGTTSYKAEDKKAKKEKMAKELGLNEKGKKALEEDEKEVTNNKAYQFPKLTEEDLKKAKEYGLTLKANFKDGDMVLTGSMENLQDFADEYLGYELSDDFLYNDDEFDYEDLEEQGQLEMVKEKEEPKKNRFEDWNKQVSRSAEIRRAMENARKNGQTPQQVMDSIAKDFDLDPAGEEFKKYKDELLKDTKMNKKNRPTRIQKVGHRK